MRLLAVNPSQILIDQHGDPVDHVAHDDVIYFADWYSRAWLEHTIRKLGRPQLVISDVEGSLAPQPVPQVFIPDLCAGVRCRYRPGSQTVWMPDHQSVGDVDAVTHTTNCFNFSINKKRHDRFLLLKLIEWFRLDSYQYTWSGNGNIMDMSPVLKEMQAMTSVPEWYTSKFLTHILSPVTKIEPLWYPLEDTIGQQYHNQTHFSGIPSDQWALFRNHLTATTAVCIVCDSSTDLEPNFTITERMLYYVGGLNFAIFAGHYGQAEQMQRMGIDTFADVIDHSYQWHNTLMERMYHAIHDNLKILTDLDYVRHLRHSMMPRLIQNKDYVLGTGLDQWIKQQYQLLPPGLTESLHQLTQNPPAINS